MLPCRSCLRRFIQGFVVESSSAQAAGDPLRQPLQNHSTKSWRRHATTGRQIGDGISKMTNNQISIRKRQGVDIRQKHIRKELEVLNDPLKLANHTLELLQKNQREKALEVLRVACKDKACTVSWNHLIDDDMANGRATEAVKTYNEVSTGPARTQHMLTFMIDEKASSSSRRLYIYTSSARPSRIPSLERKSPASDHNIPLYVCR